jgi:hypothetical protein
MTSNSIVQKPEVKLEVDTPSQEERKVFEALHELSAVELAYVGGGTYSASFI